jgi:hypothetical protein
LQAGRTVKPLITLWGAILDASADDTTLRTLWRDTVVQPRIDVTAAAIRRDQAAGAIPLDIDPIRRRSC